MEDDGYPRGLTPADLEQSLTTLRAMAAEVHAACALVRSLPGSSDRTCVVVRVHRICRDEVSYTDLRIAGTPSRFDADHSTTLTSNHHMLSTAAMKRYRVHVQLGLFILSL